MSFVSYFITDPKFSLTQTFNAIKIHKPTFVCYRNKEYFDEKEIREFALFAKQYSKTFINLHSLKNTELLELFDGVHIPSAELDKIKNYKHKTVIASTHSFKEVKKAINADFITFSPVFNSKGRKGLGVDVLKEVCNIHPNVLALGGIISEKEVEKIKNSCAKGFASIRYFYTT